MGVGREPSKKYKEKGGELENSRMCECNMWVAENYIQIELYRYEMGGRKRRKKREKKKEEWA